MVQKTSPWLEGAYGWDFGEGGWNAGMDENLLKFSFMFDRNVDSVSATLPPAVNGQAHFNTTDNRFYFAVGTTYYSSACPKWMTFQLRDTGTSYQFNGVSVNEIDSISSLDSRLEAVEMTISQLGSAAFEDVEAFATSAELDIVEGQAQAYTDTLRQDIESSGGAGVVGYGGTTVENTLDTLLPITQNITFRVPDDFPTLQAACVEASKYAPGNNFLITVQIQAGHQLTAPLDLRNVYLPHVRITSLYSPVLLAPGFVGATVTFDTFADGAIIVGVNARLPELACLIDAQGVGGSGYTVLQGSEGHVSGGAGVINAGKFGLYLADGARCRATLANFSLANWGNRVTVGSYLSAATINCSGAKTELYSGTNRTAAMDVSRGSVAYITGSVGNESNLQNSAGRGLAVRRSFVSATSVNCSGAAVDGVRAEAGAWIAFALSTADGCGVDNIACYGSWIDASGGVSAVNAGRYGLLCQDGGKVNARNAVLTGAATRGVSAVAGGSAIVNNANCRKGASDSTTDIFVSDGSIIHAVGATGGTNITPLTLNVAGLIFK